MFRILLNSLVIVCLSLLSCSSKKIKSGAPELERITVMTYNIHHCNPPEKVDVIDVDGIAAVIRNQNANLVAVQEVDVNTIRSGKINQAELLAHKAGYPFHYFGKAMDYGGGQYGLLLLSRYPLSDTQTHVLPKLDSAKEEPRVLVAATVTLSNGKTFKFSCTHLEAYNKDSRVLQAKEISRITEGSPLPFIVAGDFNAEEGSDVIQIFDEHFTRTCNSCPSTFWEGSETGAIDYIAFRKKESFAVLSHRVVQDKDASDHMPVVADLLLK